MIVCSTENPASDRDHIAIWDSAPDNALILRVPPYSVRLELREIERIAEYWKMISAPGYNEAKAKYNEDLKKEFPLFPRRA